MDERYPKEILSEDEDNGTMPGCVEEFASEVVGHRIVSAEGDELDKSFGDGSIRLTLDNGKKVTLLADGDCCAYTALHSFLLHPELVDHIITGVGTTDGYTHWHVYADAGDILELMVGWSAGNPFYYAYGFTIKVEE